MLGDRIADASEGCDLLNIKIDGLIFSYQTFPILKGIDLVLDRPGLISIIGPNGVGKSTLIHCMNKILTPTGGSVMVGGRDVKDISIKEMARIMGYVPYTTSNSFPISVIDAVMMGRHPYARHGSQEEDLRIVYETLEKLGIEDLAMRQLNELSAGQLQKVILAKGLAQQPRVLLLDEPTANLDIKHQLNVTKLLRNVTRETGMMVVMICHDLNIAAKYSDAIIMMHEGRIYSVGTPEEVITEDNLRTVYGVESKVITDQGRPHILLRDED